MLVKIKKIKKMAPKNDLLDEGVIKQFKSSIIKTFDNHYKKFDDCDSLVEVLGQEFINKLSFSLKKKLTDYEANAVSDYKITIANDKSIFDKYYGWSNVIEGYQKAKAASLFAKKRLRLKYSRDELTTFSRTPSKKFKRKYAKKKVVAFSRLYTFSLFDGLINDENNKNIVSFESIIYWMKDLCKAQFDCSQFIDNPALKEKLSWKSAFNLEAGVYLYDKTEGRSRDECDKSNLSSILTWNLANAVLNLADVYMESRQDNSFKLSERDIEKGNKIIKLLYRSEVYFDVYSDFNKKTKIYKENLESKRHSITKSKIKTKEFLVYSIDWFLKFADKKENYNTPNVWLVSKRAVDLARECQIYQDLSNKRMELLKFAYKSKLCDLKKDDLNYKMNLASILLDLSEYFTNDEERDNMMLEIYRDIKDYEINQFSRLIGYSKHLMKKYNVNKFLIIDNPKIKDREYPKFSEIAKCLNNSS